ncbi:MAG: DUF1295 domain-containing protein [Spirochaetia bacterium]|nr:DUF1295 domain-containing protein [Spirochaetia bacterium]
MFLLFAFLLSGLILAVASGGLRALPRFVADADPALVAALWALGFALASFAAGIATGDYSWVDRLWSTLPVAFAWYYAWRGGFASGILAAALVVTLWGARLTANFARRGGYSGEEDYRWAVLRSRLGTGFRWQLFNLLFISLFQVGLFVLFTLPLRSLALEGRAPNAPFLAGLALMAAAVALETAADREQWVFQEWKRRARSGEAVPETYRADVARGFRTTGLFARCRHPAYLGELSFWTFLALACMLAAGRLVPEALPGAVLLAALFAGSIRFTEGITASKYPAYAEYRKRTWGIMPKPGRRR